MSKSNKCEGKTDLTGDRCSFNKKPGHKFCGLHINKYSKWNNELRTGAFEINGKLVFPRGAYANADGLFLICDLIDKNKTELHINIDQEFKYRRVPYEEIKKFYIEVFDGA